MGLGASRWVVGVSCLIYLVGCAGVTFEKEGSKGDDGFRYYPPKPYLWIEKGQYGVMGRIISLPDVEHPQYVKYHAGWGTAEFSFSVTDGMITQFGQKSDTKGPETISAVTGGLGSIASFLTAMNVVGAPSPTAKSGMGAAAAFKLQPTEVLDAADAIKKCADTLPTEFTPTKTALGSISADLKATAISFDTTKEVLSAITAFRKEIGKLADRLDVQIAGLQSAGSLAAGGSGSISAAAAAARELGEISKTLRNIAGPEASETGLYEISLNGGRLTLKKVAITQEGAAK